MVMVLPESDFVLIMMMMALDLRWQGGDGASQVYDISRGCRYCGHVGVETYTDLPTTGAQTSNKFT